MTDDTTNDPYVGEAHRYNPYDAADPIPVPGHPRPQDTGEHEAGFSKPRRTRAIQSAQDAARTGTRQSLGYVGEEDALSSRAHSEQPQVQRPNPERAALIGSAVPSIGDTSAGTEEEDGKRRFPIPLLPTIPLATIALIALLAVLLWPKPPVTVTINGKTAEVPAGSSLKEAMDSQGIIVNPGDYVTVSGNLIVAHNGYAFSVNLNGNDLTQEEIESYRVQGSESIAFSDGKDRTEPCDVVTETIKPYLRMEGSGYEIQYVSQWAQEGVLEHRTGLESGEKADVMTKEAQDCVITCRSFDLDEDHKYVALTFDDGPADPFTQEYLDILDEYDARATFYNLGDNVQQYPELARRVVEAGHQISNHTMAHNQLTAVDDQTVKSEIERSAKVIADTCNVATTHIRPPYGDFTERSWLASGGTITAAVRWDNDSQDWRLPGVDGLVENALRSIHPGAIILMHDGGGDRSQDVEALPKIIERLQEDGYELVTVSELMRAAGDIPEEVCSGTGTMPEGCVWPDQIAPEDLEAAGQATG